MLPTGLAHPDREPRAPGRRLPVIPLVPGRYRLDQQVGQGGMAVVWRGFDTQLQRTVAVKVLHAHLLAREEVRRRFNREAQVVARLHHPHILDIYDFSGPETEPSFLVTEFIPGSSLRAFAEKHPFDPPELAAACAVSLAEALAHAHAANVVHRDLKPENVMVREDGLVKLTDFGIAALLEPDEQLTATGAILGSPAHLAPETIEGKPADPRSDLFSLGTVLYWLACGQLPFQAKTPAALLRQILDGRPPDPRSVKPAVSDGLAQVIARLLERDPDQRIQTAAEARQELLAVLREAGIEEPAQELAAFVKSASPEEAAARLRARLVARSLAQGDAAQRARRTATALACWSRVLALEPANVEAAQRVAQLRNRSRVLKRVNMLAAASALALLSALLLVQLGRAQTGRRAADERAQAERASALAQASLSAARALGIDASKPAPAAVERTKDTDPYDSSRPAPARESVDEAAAPPKRLAHARKSVLATLYVHWVWAHVFVDGVDLGESQSFTRELAVGPHRVIVSHLCCEDSTQLLDVQPGQTRYTLEPGKPRPARVAVSGAPPDAQVLIDGSAMGDSVHLAAQELPMADRPSREVLLTVGERSSRVTLQAGRTNQIDYLKLAQGTAP